MTPHGLQRVTHQEFERIVRLKASDPVAAALEASSGAPIKGSISLADLLRRPGCHSANLVCHGLADGFKDEGIASGP